MASFVHYLFYSPLIMSNIRTSFCYGSHQLFFYCTRRFLIQNWFLFYFDIIFLQLNFLVTEDRQREIVDQHCEGVQQESLDALLSVAMLCVSSSPEERPTMHRVVQVLESEVMTPCPSDFYDSNSD